MINILYLLKVLETNKISELVAEIEAAPLDIDLALDDAVEAGEVEVNRDKDYIAPLKEPVPSCNRELADKILRVMQHRANKQINITRGKLNGLIKDPMSGRGYDWHDYITTVQYLIDTGEAEQLEVSVPQNGDRPYHNFAFLCLPENPNEEWNSREINKWMSLFDKKKTK